MSNENKHEAVEKNNGAAVSSSELEKVSGGGRYTAPDGDTFTNMGEKVNTKKKKKKCGSVIATHAINAGVFNERQRTKTIILYQRKYQGRFVGEMIKRGYQIVGQSKVDRGLAANYYREFSDFIAYGNGTKKGLAVAVRYYLRAAQLFVVGTFDFLLYNNQ